MKNGMNTGNVYIGKAEYCYANSAAMLLASAGEHVSPAKIEVLSGVGLGAFLRADANLLFFSNLCALPDEGISRALKMLGFTFDEKASENPDISPFEELKAVLVTGPAILGPLEWGLLSYNPRATGPIGSDHFVLAYAMDEERIYLNDPYGFPQVSLTYEQLRMAWQAETIKWKRGYYRFWSNPKRVASPTEDQIYEAAMRSFSDVYRASRDLASTTGALIGFQAILHEAERVQNKVAVPNELDFLTGFMLPMSASRALDYAAFFEMRDKTLADLKRKQAALFGKVHISAMTKDWQGVYAGLSELAALENQIAGHF